VLNEIPFLAENAARVVITGELPERCWRLAGLHINQDYGKAAELQNDTPEKATGWICWQHKFRQALPGL
jgi:hypothetical protein